MFKRMTFVGLLLASVVLTSLRANEGVTTEIDGTWDLIGYNEEGKHDEASIKQRFMIFREKGNQVITKMGRDYDKSRFVVDSKAKPKTITCSDRKSYEVTTKGIYVLNGDVMKVAVFTDKAKKASEYPKDFEPSAGKTIATYRRAK